MNIDYPTNTVVPYESNYSPEISEIETLETIGTCKYPFFNSSVKYTVLEYSILINDTDLFFKVVNKYRQGRCKRFLQRAIKIAMYLDRPEMHEYFADNEMLPEYSAKHACNIKAYVHYNFYSLTELELIIRSKIRQGDVKLFRLYLENFIVLCKQSELYNVAYEKLVNNFGDFTEFNENVSASNLAELGKDISTQVLAKYDTNSIFTYANDRTYIIPPTELQRITDNFYIACFVALKNKSITSKLIPDPRIIMINMLLQHRIVPSTNVHTAGYKLIPKLFPEIIYKKASELDLKLRSDGVKKYDFYSEYISKHYEELYKALLGDRIKPKVIVPKSNKYCCIM